MQGKKLTLAPPRRNEDELWQALGRTIAHKQAVSRLARIEASLAKIAGDVAALRAEAHDLAAGLGRWAA